MARILVVDDSQVIRELLALNLRLEGYEVTQAADGVEALEQVAAARPDLVTLDVRMPRLDGFETLARLRADPATAVLPVVMLTARASSADLVRGDRLGADGYLLKPFEPGELLALVSRLLAERD